MNDCWEIGVFEEIAIGDTNRAPLAEGQIREFALMVSPSAPPPLQRDDIEIIGNEWLGGSRYWVRGEVIYFHETMAVIDFGIMAYLSHPAQQLPGIKVGIYLSGEIAIEVDQYDYAEYGNSLQGIPPLVYTWRIDRYQYGHLSCTRLPIAPKYEETPAIVGSASYKKGIL